MSPQLPRETPNRAAREERGLDMNRDELIDKAARIVDEEAMTLTREEFILENGTYPPWYSESQSNRQRRARHVARAIIDAVEHLIRADALTEAAYQIDRDGPANVVQWLCDRADELEKGTKG